MGDLPFLIEDPSQATPEWLGEALSERFPGTRVADVELLRVDHGTNSHARLRVTYDGACELPERLFLKIPPVDPERREAINQTGMGRREALFYRTLADRVPMRVPRSYVARLDDASGAFALVIEDLDATACSLPDVGRGIRPEQALAAMRDFAALHVRYDDLAVREDEAGWVERMPRGTDFGPTMLQYGLDHHRDKLSDAFAEVAEFYIEHQAVLEDLWEQEPETVLQGDSHVGNLFEDAGHIGFLDWGLIQLGSPMRDVGYFITMALSPENRRKHERALIERYLEARSQHGGSALSFEDAWRLYRIHAAYAVPAACPLVMFPEGLTPEAELLATSFLDRSQQVVADLDVRAMLRDVAGI